MLEHLVIDFIIVLGNSLDVGVPSDNTVSTAKIVDGAITSGKLASGVGGKVLQVVTGTTSTETSTTSTSYVATNLTASITPSSTSSKIFIGLNGTYDTVASGNQLQMTLYRNATDIITGGFLNAYNSGARQVSGASLSYLDSPSTTSSTSYTVYIKQPGGGTVKFVSLGTEASIVLMEVAV